MRIVTMSPVSYRGFTLVEVLVAVFLFTFAIAMSSEFISSGVKSNQEMNHPERWLNYLVAVEKAFQALPQDHPYLSQGVHDNPFPEIQLPEFVTLLSVRWDLTQSEEKVGRARFTAVIKDGNKRQWSIYRQVK